MKAGCACESRLSLSLSLSNLGESERSNNLLIDLSNSWPSRTLVFWSEVLESNLTGMDLATDESNCRSTDRSDSSDDTMLDV